MVAGSLTYNTKIDTSGFQKGIGDISNSVSTAGSKMKDIIGALGITKLIGVAINTINENIDAAVDRIDALNNFPKVMSNLGISADASQQSINKLSEKLRGLPTTLNDGALAVQRFASANGSVEKSTEIFLALNNAILAGGASTQIQASALEQLSQAYAKGKPDMMEWRTALMAMPAQLRQVADTFGMTSDELGEALRESNISMDEFTDRIIEMNKQGVNGFKSFEEQAKNSVDGIRTATTNMKTAIARGIGNAITSINNLLKKNNLGGVSDVINKIGNSAEKVLSKVGKLIEKINLKKILDTFKKLIPVITSVVAAFVAYEVALKAIEMINIAKSIINAISAFISLVPAITSAKDAMILLNMAFNANPIGLVVAAVAALAAGIYFLYQKTNELTEAEKKEMEELEKQTETVNNNKKAWDDLKESRQKEINGSMTEITHYEALYDELMNITDANGKVKDGYEQRASFIVGQLNDALGLEITMTDGIISNYDYLRESIQKVIEKKKAKIILDAQEDLYKKALLEQAEASGTLADLEDSLYKKREKSKKLTQEMQEAQEKYNGLVATGGGAAAEMQALEIEKIQKKIDKNNEAIKTAKENYDTQKNLVEQYAYTIGQYENNMALAHEERYSEMSTVNWKYVKDLDDAEKSKLEQLQQERYNTELHLQTLMELKDKYNTDMYDSQIAADQKTLKEIDDNLLGIQSTTDDGLKKVHLIWRNDLDDQLTTITGKDIEFKDAGDGNVQAYVDGVKVGEPTSKKEMAKLVENTINEISKKKTGSKDAGVQLINGLNSGIGDQTAQSGVFSTISNFAANLVSTLKAKLKIHSPSRLTQEIGKYTIQGFEVGMEEEEDKALRQVEKFGGDVLDKMQNAVNIETGKMSFSGTAGSVSEILNANATFEGNENINLFLDGEKVYENQQVITARKNLQYGGAR